MGLQVWEALRSLSSGLWTQFLHVKRKWAMKSRQEKHWWWSCWGILKACDRTASWSEGAKYDMFITVDKYLPWLFVGFWFFCILCPDRILFFLSHCPGALCTRGWLAPKIPPGFDALPFQMEGILSVRFFDLLHVWLNAFVAFRRAFVCRLFMDGAEKPCFILIESDEWVVF